ncbi:MAG: SDR family oxidoreductase [Dehalococcoidia bacterium]|nr:MAG: SDR family oxidoreductase [Dehalococcoidia bacterium]
MVVVTGATGHIGNVLVRQLLRKGCKVKTLIPPAEDLTPLEGLKVEIVEGDVRSLNSLIQAFQGSRIVYHLAGIISILPGRDRLLEQVNVIGTQNVIEACLTVGVQRLVYTSSIHAIEEPPHGTIIDESLSCNPKRVPKNYGRSKARATLAVLEGVERGLDAVIVHPTGIIGPYDFRISEMGQLILDFINGNLKAYIDGKYDYVDVRDVAKGIILAGDKGQSGQRYILSGEQISVYRLMLMLQEISGIKAPYIQIPLWLARIAAYFSPIYYRLSKKKPRFTTYSIDVLHSNSLISSEKARHQFGFTTRPAMKSIRDAVSWFRQNGYINSVKELKRWSSHE